LRTADALESRLWIAALLCALATVAIGAVVANRPPPRIDVEAGVLRGGAIPAALFFTALGRWPELIAFGVVAAAVATVLRTGLSAVLTLTAAEVLSQAVTALLKLGFNRPRPDAWLQIHETDLSFPSGHAASAVVFFVGFALLAWHAPLPRPLAAALAAALLACAIGIPWSRLALSAHYLTDVVGGLLLGTAFLCVALAVILRFTTAAHTA
jgi:membrane-associated phospholipid phosphatase